MSQTLQPAPGIAPEAPAARAAGIIRERSGLPIIVGQKITSPALAERVLSEAWPTLSAWRGLLSLIRK